MDSYSTLNSGVKNFLCVYLALHEIGFNGTDGLPSAYGIRLDSGDLALLAKESKLLFKHAAEQTGFDLSHLKVFASNDINEKVIQDLNAKHHQIDIFGIGTNLVTCQAQPALGMVYKLVEIKGVPKIKLSDEKEKTTLPGDKQIIRVYMDDEAGVSRPLCDVLCLTAEVP